MAEMVVRQIVVKVLDVQMQIVPYQTAYSPQIVLVEEIRAVEAVAEAAEEVVEVVAALGAALYKYK